MCAVGLAAVALGVPWASALAQKIQCTPRKDCTTAVTFAPTEARYAAAIGGSLLPTSPTTPVTLQVHQESGVPFRLEMSRTLWTPPSLIELEARFTYSGPHTPPRSTDWQHVTSAPQVVLASTEKKVDIGIEYRILVTGNEAPGRFAADVSLLVEDGSAGHGRQKDLVTNTIDVTIPAFVLLRLDGVSVGRTADVTFDYQTGSLPAYVHAIDAGLPLSFTSASFDTLQVATNNPDGYRVDVAVTQELAPPGSSLGSQDILLFGSQATGQTLANHGPTHGFVTLLRPADFGIHVDGGETPGMYRFSVSYAASPNP